MPYGVQLIWQPVFLHISNIFMGDNGCKLLLKLGGIFIIETLAPFLGIPSLKIIGNCTILSVLCVLFYKFMSHVQVGS